MSMYKNLEKVWQKKINNKSLMSVQVLFSFPDLIFITSYLSIPGSLFLLVELSRDTGNLSAERLSGVWLLEQSLLFSEVNIALSGMKKTKKSTLLLCLDGDHLGEIIDFFQKQHSVTIKLVFKQVYQTEFYKHKQYCTKWN